MSNTAWGYFKYNDIEIANSHRTLAYLADTNLAEAMGECAMVVESRCGCPPDSAPPYVTPEEDCAPWFDPTVAASGEFLGVLLDEVTGVDNSPLSRSVTASATAGGFLGRLRLGPRTISFSGTLFATSSRGMDYGKRWLVETLKASTASCHLAEARLRACCPPTGDTEGLKHAYGVGLLDAPMFGDVDDSGWCSQATQDVDWSMVAESPWLFEDTVEVGTLALDPDTAHCIEFCADDCPDTSAACEDDPSPWAYCEPWCRTDPVCVTVPATPTWGAAATVIAVTAGTTDISRLIIKAWLNPDNEDCADVDPAAWECVEPDYVIEIRHQPADTTLTIDGRARTITLTCADGSTRAGDPYVKGGHGMIEWVDVGATAMCVCAYASTENLGDDVEVSVSTAARVGG